MLDGNRRDNIKKITDKLTRLDNISIMIVMSNATALLARQELAESRARNEPNVLSVTDREPVIK